MNRWNGKVAIVTGASSGIGVAISEALVKHGIKVAGLARRLDKLKELSAKLGASKFLPIQCDLSNEDDILKAFARVEKELGGVDILVNNAGVLVPKPIIDSLTEDYRKVIDTNVIAPAICAREAVKSMRKRNVAGHIININSIAGHYADCIQFPLGMYGASKYAVTALCSELRHEFILAKLSIKVTSISPGPVETEMWKELGQAVEESLSKPDTSNSNSRSGSLNDNHSKYMILSSKDIAEAVVYALGTPQHVEVPEVTIMPQGETMSCSRAMEVAAK